jgi:hypothetical protein
LERQQENVEGILGQNFLCQIFIHFKKIAKTLTAIAVFLHILFNYSKFFEL